MAPISSNATRVCATVATPSSVWRWFSVTTSTTRPVSVWISPISAEISDAADCGLLGEPPHLVGDDGEAAALVAGASRLDRGVQRQQVRLLGDRRDRVDDAADPPGALREVVDRRRTASEEAAIRLMLSLARTAVAAPSTAARARSRRRRSWRAAVPALAAAARAASWTAVRVVSTSRT